RQLEGVMNDALDPLARVDVLLDRDLVRRPALELAAHADVGALGVFTNHNQVDGGGVAQRGQPGREQARGPQVDPEIQFEAKPEQQPGCVLRIVDPRIADRAEVDRVDGLELLEDRVGKDLPGSQVALSPQVIHDAIEPGAGSGGDGLQDPQPLGNDLGTDAVTGDDGEPH